MPKKIIHEQVEQVSEILKSLVNLSALWLVGSYGQGRQQFNDVDFLAAFADGEFNAHKLAIDELISQQWPQATGMVSDDSVRYLLPGSNCISVAIYSALELEQRLRAYASGNHLDGQRRPWAVSYWLPEALCGDLTAGKLLFDRLGFGHAVSSLFNSYPEAMALSIEHISIAEVELRLNFLCSDEDETIEANLAKADVVASLVRLAFAKSRVYLRGFRRLEEQSKNLTLRGRAVYELAQHLAVTRMYKKIDIQTIIQET